MRRLSWFSFATALFFGSLPFSSIGHAQEAPLVWAATKYFQYNIENVTYDKTAGSVKVIFSVSNPGDPLKPLWNIKTDAPFTAGGRSSRLSVDIGWDTSEYTNTGSNNGSLNPVVRPAAGGPAAASPVSVNALTASVACTGATDCPGVPNITLRYYVTAKITPLAFPNSQILNSGVAAMEGHPACSPTLSYCPAATLIGGVLTPGNVPVKSVVKYFSLTGGTAVARRQVVDINKCKGCHDDRLHNGTTIPRLSLHGANRNEEPQLCVVCHNPNQTDIPYRLTGAEVSVDFKRMVHSIHAGGFRKTPFSVVGFQGTVYDFSAVRFPSELRNCVLCHIDANGKGTFELPVKTAIGTTIATGTVQGSGFLDVDPNNDLKISPTAATCSGCHDSAEVQSHMIRTGGASFGVKQQDLKAEKCINCHGPGREEDVRRAHEIRSSSTTSR